MERNLDGEVILIFVVLFQKISIFSPQMAVGIEPPHTLSLKIFGFKTPHPHPLRISNDHPWGG